MYLAKWHASGLNKLTNELFYYFIFLFLFYIYFIILLRPESTSKVKKHRIQFVPQIQRWIHKSFTMGVHLLHMNYSTYLQILSCSKYKITNL